MYVIGIAGPSCSGKSTIAKKLTEELDAEHICLDWFYKKNAPKLYVEIKGVKHRNFEDPQLYDGERMALLVQRLRKNDATEEVQNIETREWYVRNFKKKDFCVLEGFVLYQYPALMELCDMMLYIDISVEEILRRRVARGGRGLSDQTFAVIGPEQTKIFVEPQKKHPSVSVINGNMSIDAILVSIKERLKQ